MANDLQGSAKAKGKRSTCKRSGCSSTAKARGFCIAHGGGQRCGVAGCQTGAVSRGLCISHGGGRPCRVFGCKSSAQAHGACWVHGGGSRCRSDGCSKRAQHRGMCSTHRRTTTNASAATRRPTSVSRVRRSVTNTSREARATTVHALSFVDVKDGNGADREPPRRYDAHTARLESRPYSQIPITFPSRCTSWPYSACRVGLCAIPSCPNFAYRCGLCHRHY